MPAPRDPTPSEQAEKDRLKRERLEHVRHQRSRVSSVGGSVDTLVDTLPASAQLEHGSTLTYHSSEWELMWLENIDAWQLGRICEALDEQQSQVRAFLKDTCSALTDTPWCLIDDSVHQLWYHTLDGRVRASKPRTVKRVSEIRPVSPSDARIWSWFERKNLDTGEVTREFIEPLVSHLRHPLAECGKFGGMFLVDRSYVLPGSAANKSSYLFDAGASSWSAGYGGPSLSYFAEVWKRHGFEWTRMEAWEGSTTPETFYATLPNAWKAKVEYHQQWISTSPSKRPFVPSVIAEKIPQDAYVVFKLDIDAPAVETAIVDYLLAWNELGKIDEFLWEHHVDNYLMAPSWGMFQDMSMSIADSYHYFLKLRQHGVRAHSWV